MGLGQAYRRRAESNGQLGCGIGAKSLDRDLGDVHTWPHSHYLMRLCNGVSGWVGAAKVQLVQMQVRCESIIWWRKRLIPFPSLSSMTPLCPFDPFCSPDPYPALNPFGPFPPTLLYSALRFPEIAGYLFRFQNCVGCASDVELQSHRLNTSPRPNRAYPTMRRPWEGLVSNKRSDPYCHPTQCVCDRYTNVI